jgi:hypothetical protein
MNLQEARETMTHMRGNSCHEGSLVACSGCNPTGWKEVRQQELAQMQTDREEAKNGGVIKTFVHAELPAMFICPTCLKPALFQLGEPWQLCEEKHLTEARSIGARPEGGSGVTVVEFANGEARQIVDAEEAAPAQKNWAPPTDNTYGMR